jgi:acyl-CoA hydrolase
MKPVMIGEIVWVKAEVKFVDRDSILVELVHGAKKGWIRVKKWETSSKPDVPIERQGLL